MNYLSTPTQFLWAHSSVNFHVSAWASKQFQVLDAIVICYLVLMMNQFVSLQHPAEMFRENDSMLKALAMSVSHRVISADKYSDISTLRAHSTTTPGWAFVSSQMLTEKCTAASMATEMMTVGFDVRSLALESLMTDIASSRDVSDSDWTGHC